MSYYITLIITALFLLNKRIVYIIKNVKVTRALIISLVKYVLIYILRLCKKSGIIHIFPNFNYLKIYQKIAKVLANYKKALIHVYVGKISA